VRSRSVAIALQFGDPRARAVLRETLADRGADLDLRREALAALLKVKDPLLASALHRLALEPGLSGTALRGLSVYDDPATPGVLTRAYPRLEPTERRDALNTLATRKDWAKSLLAAIENGTIPRADLTADLVRQIRTFKDTEIDLGIIRVWGSAREPTADKARLIARYKALLLSRAPRPPDPSLGRAVFAKNCQQCHTLFGGGRTVGPDLTGSNRSDLDYILSNVLDPSALIGKDYLAHTIATTDGRILTGIIRAEDKDTISLVTANDTVLVPKAEVEVRRQSEQSMMPDDLWTPLSEHEIRSLVAYLAGAAQVAMPAPD
jgi:putative heme-binding domain-containing protein